MLLNNRKRAFLGVLLALTVLLIILSGVFEFNTLFLLAAASFGVGIAIRESGLSIGVVFYLGAVALGFFLAPNKLYCITFAAMGMYLLIREFAFEKLAHVTWKNRTLLFYILKYVSFNLMYLPVIFLMPKVIYSGEINSQIYLLLVFAGQLVLFLYDWAYDSFQVAIWDKIRNKLNLK